VGGKERTDAFQTIDLVQAFSEQPLPRLRETPRIGLVSPLSVNDLGLKDQVDFYVPPAPTQCADASDLGLRGADSAGAGIMLLRPPARGATLGR